MATAQQLPIGDNISSPTNTGQHITCAPITVQDTLPLRHLVLWPDKPISHVILPEDKHGVHFGAFLRDDGKPVAVISFFVESAGADAPLDGTKSQIRFRKFACDPVYQGRGIGSMLLQYGLSAARTELHGDIVWCDARTTSSDWYKKRGLIPFGETFHKGTVEYIRMYIDLRNPEPLQDDDN